ncbi:hypothetical protein [Fundidesulfovibrio putealis]|uniref:hypothetical protein n=1 Tax=Fundidesulfovibrio putealis TaxID=270496 RepID=UPI000481354F|nr:hypothetical protein [Fundidesulfovibrio putealis]
MSSVQGDIWTILGLVLIGTVPLALVLGYMFLRPKPFKPNVGEPSDAYQEALYDEEKHPTPPIPDICIPGDGPLSWPQRIAYEIAGLVGAALLSLILLLLLRLSLFIFR